MDVKLIGITGGAGDLVNKTAQEIVSYVTRVSNPNNQNNFATTAKLLKYCIQHAHWSPFETVSLTVEIKTSRAIAAQILRHKSFSFQEFSQRYSNPTAFELYNARRQDLKNKQNSIDDMPNETNEWFIEAQQEVNAFAFAKYEQAIEKGIAKEQARFLLTAATSTTLYMTGNLRSWIHYIVLRSNPDTQKEHRDIAVKIRDTILIKEFPDISEALGWRI